MSHDDDNLGDESLRPPARPSESSRWRFKREISSGDILLAGSILIGMFLWGGKIETRLSVVETRQAVQFQIDAKQDESLRDAMTRIERALADIQQHLLGRAMAR